MDWDLGSLEELQKSNFGIVTNRLVISLVVHFNSRVAVFNDGVLDQLENFVGKVRVEQSVVTPALDNLVLDKELCNLEVSSGQSTGFTDKNLVNLPHLFRGPEIFQKDAISLHARDRVSDRQTNSHWETFGDSNNDDSQELSEIVGNKVQDVVHVGSKAFSEDHVDSQIQKISQEDGDS